jgi:hypothetical protein
MWLRRNSRFTVNKLAPFSVIRFANVASNKKADLLIINLVYIWLQGFQMWLQIKVGFSLTNFLSFSVINLSNVVSKNIRFAVNKHVYIFVMMSSMVL